MQLIIAVSIYLLTMFGYNSVYKLNNYILANI
jgi:hypothetical protein